MTTRATLLFLSLVLGVASVCVSQAQAGPTTFDLVFSADFTSSSGPIISGEFLATFDPAIDVTDGTVIPIGSWTNFTPDIGHALPFMNVLQYTAATGELAGIFQDSSISQIFGIGITGFSGTPPLPRFFGAVLADFGTGAILFTDVGSPVPIPPSLVLMGTGLLGLAVGRLRQRRARG